MLPWLHRLHFDEKNYYKRCNPLISVIIMMSLILLWLHSDYMRWLQDYDCGCPRITRTGCHQNIRVNKIIQLLSTSDVIQCTRQMCYRHGCIARMENLTWGRDDGKTDRVQAQAPPIKHRISRIEANAPRMAEHSTLFYIYFFIFTHPPPIAILPSNAKRASCKHQF